MTPQIVQIRTLSPDRLAELVAESEQGGLQLVRRLQLEWQSGENRFDGPGEALFVAVEGPEIVGACGLNLDPYLLRPGVGRLRHLYVLSAHRRHGIGSCLVREVIATARQSFDRLRLRTNDPAAARFYERLGFRTVDNDPSATHELDFS